MKSMLFTIILMAVFAMTPSLVYAQAGQQETPTAPLSQPLIREGTLAVELTQHLNVGNPSSEAEAESELSAAGIAPRNGWIADYPVTPDIVGELQASISAAADSGKIALSKDAALKAFDAVLVEDKLDITTGGSAQTAQETAPPAYPDTSEIGNYYYDEGPPVVTYYAPPADYAYLYTWTPYPFWWSDFWFPGFYILGDFDVEVHGHHEFHHEHEFGHENEFRHGHHEHHEFVTNHFRDSDTGRLLIMNPTGGLRAGRTGFAAGRGRAWTNPSARRGASAILNRSRSMYMGRPVRPSAPSFGNGRVAVSPAPNRLPSGRSFSPPPARSISPASPAGRVHGSTSFNSGHLYTYSAPPRYIPRGGGNWHAQSFGGRAFSAQPRTFSAPAHTFSAPQHSYSAPMHSFSAPASGGRAFGSFGGGFGGGRAFGGGRGSFGGGGRGFSGGSRR